MIRFFRLFRCICSIVLIGCFLFANISTANAMLSEAASLAITAAEGVLQEDDKKLEQAILKELNDESKKEQLRKYVERTRPMIKDKASFFNEKVTPAFIWVMQKMPSVGNVLMGTVVSVYVTHYESQLADDADSDMLKKFAKLRENNIEAGQGIFETLMDLYDPTYDKDSSNMSIITDATLIAAKGKQYYDRYTSSAAAIATVLEAAGVPMQAEDAGDICSGQFSKSKQNTNQISQANAIQNNSSTPSTFESQASSSSSNNTSYVSNNIIGNIKLGETLTSVNQKLGEPTKKTAKENKKLNCEYNNMDVSFVNNKVIGIAVDDKNVSTPKGIHTGSSIQDVLDIYGGDYILSTYDDLDLYEYEYMDDNSRTYYLRFAVKQSNSLVKYISLRYVN